MRKENPDLSLRVCLICDQNDPSLYFSLERFIMVDISWIIRSVFDFKISIPFPDESSEIFFLLSICAFFH